MKYSPILCNRYCIRKKNKEKYIRLDQQRERELQMNEHNTVSLSTK